MLLLSRIKQKKTAASMMPSQYWKLFYEIIREGAGTNVTNFMLKGMPQYVD